jgi:hypothetical protein
VRNVDAEPLFPRGRFCEFGITAEAHVGEREPGDWRHDPRLDVATGEKMPKPRLHKQAVSWLGRIRIKRGERQRFYGTTFAETVLLSCRTAYGVMTWNV